MLKDYVGQPGLSIYQNQVAKVRYIFGCRTNQPCEFISFDEAWSIKEKAKYAKENGLAGWGVWELSQNVNNELITVAKEAYEA